MLDGWGAVLGAVVDGARAWSTAADLADALQWAVADVVIIVDELVVNGMLAAWAPDGAPAWTLTPLSAEGLHVSLCEHGNGVHGRLAWRRDDVRGDDRRRRPGRGRVELPDGGDPLRHAPDPRPGPAAIAEAADEADHWKPRGPLRVDQLPRPTVILLGSETTWSEAPARVAGRRTPPPRKGKKGKGQGAAPAPYHCSACRGQRLRPSAYCLRCGRWGLDGLVAAHRRAAVLAAREAS